VFVKRDLAAGVADQDRLMPMMTVGPKPGADAGAGGMSGDVMAALISALKEDKRAVKEEAHNAADKVAPPHVCYLPYCAPSRELLYWTALVERHHVASLSDHGSVYHPPTATFKYWKVVTFRETRPQKRTTVRCLVAVVLLEGAVLLQAVRCTRTSNLPAMAEALHGCC
jgi:hypothetical protein